MSAYQGINYSIPGTPKAPLFIPSTESLVPILARSGGSVGNDVFQSKASDQDFKKGKVPKAIAWLLESTVPLAVSLLILTLPKSSGRSLALRLAGGATWGLMDYWRQKNNDGIITWKGWTSLLVCSLGGLFVSRDNFLEEGKKMLELFRKSPAV